MSGLPGRLVLLGHPLGHTLSPAFQTAALRKAGIPLVYEAMDVPRNALEETIERLRRERWAGNVTIPYKGDFAVACNRLSAVAARTGAVNTFWCAVDGALVGDNTDVDGFDTAAQAMMGGTPRGSTVALFGAGGGAAAVLHAMERWQVSAVRVYARHEARARGLAERFAAMPVQVVGDAADAVRDATVVVNATPIGLLSDEMPVAVDALRPDAVVLDLVYRRGDTPFVRAARARGLRALDGLPMLVEQGALAFERWFSVRPDREVMWAAIGDSR